MATGVAASFVSTLASQKLITLVERDRALWPYAAYRLGLASAVLLKLRRERRRRGAAPDSPGPIAASQDGAGRPRMVESTP
jgi:membrane-bound lytic murein transglycosylase MltF